MIAATIHIGWNRLRANLRLVVLAWGVNTLLALLVAVPFLNQLDSYLAPTARDEELLARMDENWYRTYQFDMQANPAARLLDYSVIGAAPFVHHLDGLADGNLVRSVSRFVWDSITGLRFASQHLTLMVLLGIAYSITGMFLSTGFISAYSGSSRISIAEFIADGARYFGRSFRVGMIGFVLMYVVVEFAGRRGGAAIAEFTRTDASEFGAFLLYMLKNALVLMLLWMVTLATDYARVRIVLEERSSALSAFGAGTAFLFRNARFTFTLAIIILLVSAAWMAAFGWFLEGFPAVSAGTIALMFIAQQAYLIGRMTVKAGTYACEVEMFRTAIPDEDNMHPQV